MELYDYQKEAVKQALYKDKHFIIAGTGLGKTAIAMNYVKERCENTGKRDVLVVTTASKARTDDFQTECDQWNGECFRKSLNNFEVISWHKLKAWQEKHSFDSKFYVIIWDEIQKASAGTSSGMGTAFLRLTKNNADWVGFTATPGDTWLKFYPYFVATGLSRNKTSFLKEYATIQTYKGYPEIVEWRHEATLKAMWEKISYAPDASKVVAELPSEQHKVITFKKPTAYVKTLKTRTNSDGEFLDTAGALCSELRRLCFTKDKQEWVADFAENLGTGAVVFFNFTKTGDLLEQILTKALKGVGKVWRIDGTHHEIPTRDTIGERDIVMCQWQSGSEALNLQFLHYWVSIEPCYSYSTSVQARGRIKRIGQEHPMFYYYLLTDNTIEQDIMKCLKGKSDFSQDVWFNGKE